MFVCSHAPSALTSSDSEAAFSVLGRKLRELHNILIAFPSTKVNLSLPRRVADRCAHGFISSPLLSLIITCQMTLFCINPQQQKKYGTKMRINDARGTLLLTGGKLTATLCAASIPKQELIRPKPECAWHSDAFHLCENDITIPDDLTRTELLLIGDSAFGVWCLARAHTHPLLEESRASNVLVRKTRWCGAVFPKWPH